MMRIIIVVLLIVSRDYHRSRTAVDADSERREGGSLEIEFNEQTFQGQSGKFSNKDKSRASVEITDHNSNKTQAVTLPANGSGYVWEFLD